jgi:hypothetical protein
VVFGELSVSGETLASEEHAAMGDGGGGDVELSGGCPDAASVSDKTFEPVEVHALLGEVVEGEAGPAKAGAASFAAVALDAAGAL